MEQTVRSWYEIIAHSNTTAYTSSDKQLLCPLCGAKAIKGKFGYFCSSKKDTGCKFSIPTEICSKKISDTQVLRLIEKGKTTLIKGFKSKTGKEFDAALKLDKTTGKIEFEFPKRNS